MTRCLAAVLCLLCASALGRAADLTFQWDPNPPGDEIRGYNLYRVEPGAPGQSIYTRLTPSLIEATQYTASVQPGWSIVARAVNDLDESADSNVVTIPAAPPAPPAGLKVHRITIEQSSDLREWTDLAQIDVPADADRQFFLIRC